MIARQRLNFIIDALMLMLLCAIALPGLLVKFVLLPGREAWARYDGKVQLLLWGMERHEWGSLHLLLGGAFIAVLVVHIALHWNVLAGMQRGMIRSRGGRLVIGWLFIIACLIMLLFPLISRPEIREGVRRYRMRAARQSDTMRP